MTSWPDWFDRFFFLLESLCNNVYTMGITNAIWASCVLWYEGAHLRLFSLLSWENHFLDFRILLYYSPALSAQVWLLQPTSSKLEVSSTRLPTVQSTNLKHPLSMVQYGWLSRLRGKGQNTNFSKKRNMNLGSNMERECSKLIWWFSFSMGAQNRVAVSASFRRRKRRSLLTFTLRF